MDPSVPTIAAESGLGRSTVIRELARLEVAGWIQREQRHGCRTRYTLATRPTAGPERTKERAKERTNTQAAALWSVYVEEMSGQQLTLTSQRAKLLAALHSEQLVRDSNPTEAFRRILKAVKASDHHMSNRDYVMVESLFRSPERRERWAERGRTNKPSKDPLLMSSAELMQRERAS
jgi:DNA-binding transcriptional regulator PaaX